MFIALSVVVILCMVLLGVLCAVLKKAKRGGKSKFWRVKK